MKKRPIISLREIPHIRPDTTTTTTTSLQIIKGLTVVFLLFRARQSRERETRVLPPQIIPAGVVKSARLYLAVNSAARDRFPKIFSISPERIMPASQAPPGHSVA